MVLVERLAWVVGRHRSVHRPGRQSLIIPYASRTGTRRNLDALRERGWRLLVSASGVLRTEGFRYARVSWMRRRHGYHRADLRELHHVGAGITVRISESSTTWAQGTARVPR
jgi:hypothetical protein